MNRPIRGLAGGAAMIAAAALSLLLGSNDAAAGGYGGFGPWQAAQPLTEINTGDGEGCPVETRDGLSLMFASTRPGGSGNLDVWVADRGRIGDGWQPPRAVPLPINSESNDLCPTPVGRYLYFVSDRPLDGGCGGGDILVSRQSPAGDWSDPELLGCAPNGPNFSGPERSPAIVRTRRGTLLFYSSTGGEGDHDIYVSRQRADGSFGPGKVVSSLSSEFDDFMPNIRARGYGLYEVVFNSNRPYWGRKQNKAAFGNQDVYAAYSYRPDRRWTTPRNLGPNVNTAGSESRATLSGDGQRLVFGRDGDLQQSQRGH